MRQLTAPGAPWAATVGYSRAVRVGSVVEVAGTTAQDGDATTGHDEYTQTKRILGSIAAALPEAGDTLAQVVRTRIFVTDSTHWEAVGWAHGEVFGTIGPCAQAISSGPGGRGIKQACHFYALKINLLQKASGYFKE